MKNNTSNNTPNHNEKHLEQVFQQLTTIKKVTPSVNLYDSIITNLYAPNKIKQQETVSLFYLRIVAAMLLLFFSFEIILLRKDYNSTSSNLKMIVVENSNVLYNE